jgi:ligand-binding sensor domain-containing protein
VAEGNSVVYAIADGSLYSYGKDDNSLRYYSKETGLSDNLISCIGFNSEENTLVAVYTNGNIDLIGENNSVYNIPFLLNSGNIQDKSVYSVYNNKEMSYLSTAFGIVALNVEKKEIKETYRLNLPVYSTVIYNEHIYAVTSGGDVVRASLTNNLLDPANWSDYPFAVSEGVKDTVRQVCVFQNVLCLLVENKGIYYVSNNGVQPLLNHASIKSIKVENGKLTAFSSGELFIYSSLTERDRGNIAGITDISSLKDNNTFWLATGTKGIVSIRRTGANQYQTLVNDIVNDGPKRNFNAFLRMHNNKLYVAGGGRWTNRFFNPGTVMIYDTDSLKWNNLKDINGFQDATCIAVDPKDDSHLFVSTCGEVEFEFKDGELLQRYNHTNSALNTIYPGSDSQYNYVRVEGVCFDKDGNLWMTNNGVSDAVVVMKADGTWINLRYDDISNSNMADKILMANNGHKWINLVRMEKSGIFVFDDKGTTDDTSDDVSHYYSSLNDNSGDIGASEFLCITEDRKGYIWIGTNRGALVVSTPSRGVEGNMTGSRIIHKDESGNMQYFLADERVNAIAVDGGNRKWIGAYNSGLYLVSEDGAEIIHHFTTANSPLLSDNIQSIAINDFTGEVFIGTAGGLISYMGEATKGSETYSNVYAFPNPVRPDYDRQVVITGLMENSNVKITDARGNLVYQGRSAGGQISWNCRNRNGNSVASGIYLVLASTPEALESVVTKIAVVR